MASSRFRIYGAGNEGAQRGVRAGLASADRASLIIFETEVDGASETSLARFLAKARREVGLSGQVNVVVTTNDGIRDLNRRFRKKKKPTDVLSFPAGERFQSQIAGDIVVSADIAAENAARLGHSLATELKVLLLHGVLHLAGYDHEADYGKMERKERKLRMILRLPGALIERTVQGGAAGQQGRTSRLRDSRRAAGATKASGAERSSRERSTRSRTSRARRRS